MSKVRMAGSPMPDESDKSFRSDVMRILMTDLGDLFKRNDAEAAARHERDTRLAELLIRDAIRERATDVHIDPLAVGSRVRFRVDGRVIDAAELTDAQTNRVVNQIKTLSDLDPVRRFAPEDARFTLDLDGTLVDVRFAIVPSVTGDKIAIRLLDPARTRNDMAELGLSPHDIIELKSWLDNTSGMILVGGPTGSGKTTLLYALLHELRRRQWSIATIEDPVEYQIDGITQIQVDKRHGLTFAGGLRTMLRLDPDFLMVGEVRDLESARAAIDASVSGHALMSTMHARDAVSTITALRNWGCTDLEIAVSLSVVVSQRLVRVLCEQCKQQKPTTHSQKAWFTALGHEPPAQVWDAVGCDECRGIGYLGRTAVFETWRLDDEDYNLILTGVDELSLRRHLVTRGHRTLADDGIGKAVAGVTTISELFAMPDVGAITPTADAVVPPEHASQLTTST